MATSTIRFAIIVALVVVGAVVIAQFPRAVTSTTPGQTTPTPTAPSPGNGGGQGNGNNDNGGGTQPPTASLAGVKVGIAHA